MASSELWVLIMKTVFTIQHTPAKTAEALQRIKATLDKAAKKEVAVGYPVDVSGLGVPEPNYDDEVSIIEVALKNNYGLGVPRRAFMDLASKSMEDTFIKVMSELGPPLMNGEADIEKVLDVAGLLAEDDVRNAIREGNWRPNSKATIERKGSDVPLIDTGTMVNRVTHRVRDR